jgi:hypothetical protein
MFIPDCEKSKAAMTEIKGRHRPALADYLERINIREEVFADDKLLA